MFGRTVGSSFVAGSISRYGLEFPIMNRNTCMDWTVIRDGDCFYITLLSLFHAFCIHHSHLSGQFAEKYFCAMIAMGIEPQTFET